MSPPADEATDETIVIDDGTIDKSSARKRKKEETTCTERCDLWDLVWPQRSGVLGNTTGECTLLLQIEPEDASNLDMEGASGAIGRLEAGSGGGVVLDMKGRQYHGYIYPGPTALLLGTQASASEKQQLKVLGMTDEFARCVRRDDALDRPSTSMDQVGQEKPKKSSKKARSVGSD